MKSLQYVLVGCLILLAVLLEFVQPTCVLESDFGFKINCAFKKSGLFRVRNLGGVKAHASLGFSLGDELGFEQSLTNMDPSRRRSVNVKNGAPNAVADASRTTGKQEKRGKQNRIMMRPPAPVNRPNQAAMDKLTSLHRRVSTMQPIIVGPTIETPRTVPRATVTMAKPMPMGVPPFRPLPPKEDTLQVLPLTTSRKSYTPLQLPQSKGPGVAYKSEHYTNDQFSKMVSQMTAAHNARPQLLRITPSPIMVNTPKIFVPTTINPFVPMPVQVPPAQAAISIIPAPVFRDSVQIPLAPSMLSKTPTAYSLAQNTLSIQKTNPVSNFVDPVPYQVHDLASFYPVNTKKIDDYNTITGYGDDTTLKFNKEDINAKIVEIAKAGNISMEAVEAAIALRQQQLLSKYANLPLPTSTTTSTTTTTTTTTEVPLVYQPEPEVLPPIPQVPKRNPTTGKVMNAPREYYPVGYEKNFDDHFQSKVDLPETTFHCGDQKYFPGLYGDEGLGCMVFHVCALTDDGLVMKSFLCPESTLFDQTILKCNWWFYVDCKNTRQLYDTNIPVSKSYQLMKALTFFSSYRKEMQEDSKNPVNPEEVTGIKEAITILENQESKPVQSNSQPIGVQIITPQPIIDERSNHKVETTSESAPVYRGTRNYRNFTITNTTKPKTQEEKSSKSEYKLITLTTGLNFRDDIKNATNNSKITDNSAERKHRRRVTLRNNNTLTVKPTTTTKLPTTITAKAITTKLIEVTTPSVEIIKQEIRPIENLTIKQETLTDQLEDSSKIDPILIEASPVKRFYRSSAERDSNENKEKANINKEKMQENKEMAIVNNEKVQIIRPTSMARLVGEFQTPTVTIAKLDEAVLGKPSNSRFKKSSISVVTPQNDYLDRNIKEQT